MGDVNFAEVLSNLVVGGVLLFALGMMQRRYYTYLDLRFKGIEDTQKTLRGDFDGLQKQHSDLRTSLPRDYVAREDWIRFSTTIDAKLDALYREGGESERRLRDEIRRSTTPSTHPSQPSP